MHGKSFLERFRSKNAPTSRPAKGAERQKPAHRPRAKRLIGAPLEFVADVCRLTEGRAALVVALCIYRRVSICGSQTVTLPSGELAELGVNLRRKREAWVKLKKAGLIRVETTRGRTAKITLLWRSP